MPRAVAYSTSTDAPPPAVPQAVEPTLTQPCFEYLINESSKINNNKLLTLFRLVIGKGTHKLKQGNSPSKNAWIDSYETAFDNNFSSQGPFSMHKVHGSRDRQDKLKKLVKRLAHHFCVRHNTKAAEFIEDGGEPVYTDAERLGYQIFTEHELVLCSHKQTADAKKLAAIETTKKLEQLESFVGAVPAHRGVNAPSGIELDDCIK